MYTFDRKTYLNAKAISPEMALAFAVREMKEVLLEFTKEMEKKNQESLEMILYEIEKKFEAKLDAKIVLFASQIKSKHDQRLIQDIVSDTLANIKGEMGEKGEKGEKGESGYSPIKSVDYWTSQDINAIATHLYGILKKDLMLTAGTDYPTEEQMREHVAKCMSEMPKYDEKELLTKLQKMFPKLEIDPKVVVQKINGLPIKPEFQIDASHIKNLPRVQGPRQLGGKGGTGGGGVSWKREKLSPTASGANITLNLASLSRAFTEILGVFRQGQLLETEATSGWTRSGNTVTVYNATTDESFYVDYAHS